MTTVLHTLYIGLPDWINQMFPLFSISCLVVATGNNPWVSSPILDPRSSFTRKPVSCMSLHDSGNSWDMMLPPWSSRVERYCGNCHRERVFHHRSNSCANFETITCRLVDSGPVYEGTRVGFTELVAVTMPKSSWNSNYVLSREKTVNVTSILASGWIISGLYKHGQRSEGVFVLFSGTSFTILKNKNMAKEV